MKRALLMVAAVLVAVAGCSTNNPGELTAAAQRVLVPRVQHVREVAAFGDYRRLQVAVDELKALVRQEEAAGQVTPARAAAIMDAADALVQDASPSPTPSPSSTSPSPTPSPSSTSPSPTPSPTTTSPTPSTSSSPTPTVSLSAGIP